MLRVLAKETAEIFGGELDLYSGLDEQLEETLRLLDRGGLLGSDRLRRSFEVVGVEAEGERGTDVAEFVLLLAGLLDETAAEPHRSPADQLAAKQLASLWREQTELDQTPQADAMLSVAEVAAHFSVTPQAVYKWCEAGKIDFERTPGGGYRIPAGQFDWARGRESAPARREIAERLLAKPGEEPAPSEEEMVAAMRRARRGE